MRIIILILFSFGSVACFGQTREANLKAVFIYNFTKYIEWNNTLGEGDFVIGIIGSSPITEPLLSIAKTNKIKNRKIVVRSFSRPADITKCNILFIPRNTSFSLMSILDQAGKGVLTIGEDPGFASMGTALNFIISNDKLKFEANLAAISAAGLTVSSQLLKLAIIVD